MLSTENQTLPCASYACPASRIRPMVSTIWGTYSVALGSTVAGRHFSICMSFRNSSMYLRHCAAFPHLQTLRDDFCFNIQDTITLPRSWPRQGYLVLSTRGSSPLCAARLMILSSMSVKFRT